MHIGLDSDLRFIKMKHVSPDRKADAQTPSRNTATVYFP